MLSSGNSGWEKVARSSVTQRSPPLKRTLKSLDAIFTSLRMQPPYAPGTKWHRGLPGAEILAPCGSIRPEDSAPAPR